MQVNPKSAAAQPAAVQRTAEPAEERRSAEFRPSETGASFPRAAERSAPVRPAAEAASGPLADAVRERLVSGATNNAVSAAFGSLARTVASNSRTVDDLVAEAVRPMLKEWLDEHLPELVERLVRAEIERVARQGQ
ncbi:DUF2497 domain-containing protein [Ancylobacter sp. MQZ15Z-1]|uniref:DUF2497 domain-containing protein n=2 Tax=Ancylobacter mangrovi TaxID=2972472 RepID=A0A9X2PL40_9HYPH|nr:DUF2497 domain-containing protein [Ancylobacter mangrovi]